MAAEHIIPGADAKCPKCGAPCKAKVNERGGDWGWGTSDRERTTYAYVAPQALADVQARAAAQEWLRSLAINNCDMDNVDRQHLAVIAAALRVPSAQ